MSDIRRRQVPRSENDIKRRSKSSSGNAGLKTNRLMFYFLTALVFTTCILGVILWHLRGGNILFSISSRPHSLGTFAIGHYIHGVYFHLFQRSGTYSHNANLFDNLSLTLGLMNYVHTIVIDAGSTGSRIHVFGFVSSSGGESLKLHKDFFKEVKPGISSFASNPEESVKNLGVLINEAKAIIPKEEWQKTSLVMKATAGLRLLSGQKAFALLNEARKFLRKTGLRVKEEAVSIMDGTEEGLLSWFTINFLLDRLGSDTLETVVALDLGGGSTQVSFVPFKNETLTSPHSEHLTKITAFHKEMDVFSRSFLGLGLNEGRKRILQHNNNHSTDIRSECINPIVKTKWNYGGVTYSIKGPEKAHFARSEEKGEVFTTPIVDFKECEEIVKSVLSKFGKSPSLSGKEIYAFSYYYDRAADSGLIDFKKGGSITLRDFINMAKAKCQEANVDQPFICLDLVFISSLLKETFGLPETSVINLVKKVDKHEVSWALGAAFLHLQNQTV